MLSRARTRRYAARSVMLSAAGAALTAAPVGMAADLSRLHAPSLPAAARRTAERRHRAAAAAPPRASRRPGRRAIRCVVNEQRARVGLNPLAGEPPARARREPARARHGPPQLLQPRLAERQEPAPARPRRRLAPRRRRGARVGLRPAVEARPRSWPPGSTAPRTARSSSGTAASSGSAYKRGGGCSGGRAFCGGRGRLSGLSAGSPGGVLDHLIRGSVGGVSRGGGALSATGFPGEAAHGRP